MESDTQESKEYANYCMEMCLNFMFISYFRVRKKLRYSTIQNILYSVYLMSVYLCRTDRDYWVHNINSLVSKNKHSCVVMMRFLAEADSQKFLK